MNTRTLAVFVLLLSATCAGCSPPPDPIVVAADRIGIVNQTKSDWQDVVVTVNRYYVVRVPILAAGGRFDAPIDRLQGGFGRYFDPKRERIRSVRVIAKNKEGEPVALDWPAPPQ